MSNFFDKDQLKRFATQAKTATAQAAAAARVYATAAAHAGEAAASAAMKSAQQALGGSPALALVGQELNVAGKHLMVEALLAEGGFASVYSCVVPETAEKLVLKKMYASGREVIEQLSGEVKLMEKLSHPNIVKVFGSETRRVGDGVEIYVLMELCPGGHLLARINKLVESKGVLPFEKIMEVFLSIVRPVAYMHAMSPPIAHRDLKFENILIAADGSLRLCDFGSASTHRGIITDRGDRAEQEDAIIRFTTPHFRSPEMVDLYSGLSLDERSDVWALGCMLYGLAYFKHPFQDGGNLAILSAKYKIPYKPAYPAPIYTLIRACCQFKPDDRPTAAQIVAYIEAVQKCPKTGPWPALQLSGGGSATTTPMPAPPPDNPTAEMYLVNYTSTASNPASDAFDESEGGSGARPAAKPAFHRPTAAEIAAQIQAAPAAAPSAALAKRLGKRGGAAPAPMGAPGSISAAAVISTPSAATPSPAAAEDASAFFGEAAAVSAPQASTSAARRPSGAEAAPVPTVASHSASADFGFDAFGSGIASGGDFDAFGSGASAPAPVAAEVADAFSMLSVSAPTTSHTRQPSPPSPTFGASPQSAASASHRSGPSSSPFDDMFSSGPAATATASSAPVPAPRSAPGHAASSSSGLDDLFGASSAPSPAPAPGLQLDSLYSKAPAPMSGGFPGSAGGYPSMAPRPAGMVPSPAFGASPYGAPAGFGVSPAGMQPMGFAPGQMHGGFPPAGPGPVGMAAFPRGPAAMPMASAPAPAPAKKTDPFGDLFSAF